MRQFLATLRLPAIIGLILILPFMVLEYVNRRDFHEGFPVPLFGILWLLAAAFIFALVPIVRDLRGGNPIGLALRVALLILIAWLWVAIVLDQMPCFLGVPNCD